MQNLFATRNTQMKQNSLGLNIHLGPHENPEEKPTQPQFQMDNVKACRCIPECR